MISWGAEIEMDNDTQLNIGTENYVGILLKFYALTWKSWTHLWMESVLVAITFLPNITQSNTIFTWEIDLVLEIIQELKVSFITFPPPILSHKLCGGGFNSD